MKDLKPVRDYECRSYPKAAKRLLSGFFAAAAMTTTALAGCGPAMDSYTVDSALDTGDLDATVDACDDASPEPCEPQASKPD